MVSPLRIRIRVKLRLEFPKVIRKEQDASLKALARAGAFTRKVMKRQLRAGKAYAKPGSPPKFRGPGQSVVYRVNGRFASKAAYQRAIAKGETAYANKSGDQSGVLKRAIIFGVEPRHFRVLIGPSGRVAGSIGWVHEFGKRFRKRNFPKRPFAKPGLEKARAAPCLSHLWGNILK